MRLPYVHNPPPTTTPEEQAIVERIAARRAPRPLQALDLTLLHSPPVADGWNAFLGAIRTRTDAVPDDARELAITRVAAINRAWYEWAHHAPLAVAAGISQAIVDGVVREVAGPLDLAASAEAKGGLDQRLWTVLCLADEMTRNVEVSDATFDAVRGLLGERGTVELVATIAAYNCVSRFLVALNVGERNGTGPSGPIDF
ncbi:unnamed protein product [Peniophora sp. CBMAI 1063]|nr:unnamed protein product [Peniophora sp. CBMAI 1063]